VLEYAFRIYGINVYTNYDLRKYIRINNIHSNVADDLNNVRLIISFIEPNVTKQGIFLINNHKCIFAFSGCEYLIDVDENLIEVKVCDIDIFLNSFMNIPFSLYFMLKKKIVLHACAINVKDRIVCFSGAKGAGKSTLLFNLLKNNACFFSDDTILINDCVDNLVNCFKTLDIIKIERNSIWRQNDLSQYYLNIQKKYYIPVSDLTDKVSPEKGILHSIYFLRKRANSNDLEIKEITNKEVKKIMLIKSISGYNSFDENLKRCYFIDSFIDIVVSNVNFYTLELTDDINRINEQSKKLYQYINDNI